MMMQQQSIHYIFLAIFLLLSHNEVQGGTKLSYLEDLELEKQLKFLNKPAVRTIKTDDGDIYDCVDFYQQPAFDDPLLQSHTFHPKMKPTLSLIKEDHDDSITDRLSKMRLKKKSCPDGTVPIRRTTKDDLIRQKHMPPAEDVSFSPSLSSENKFNNKVHSPSNGYKLAIVQTKNNPSNKFGGAGMLTTIYNPRVEGQQHSASRLKIQKGSENIQVGWRVDPTLYGDNKTRLYTHFQAGKTQCFNTQCPGFVIVNTEIPLDYVFSKVTQRGDDFAWQESMYITRDLANGNWWLLLTINHTEIGFWPQRLFTELNDFASSVEWGGVTYSPQGTLVPPMGLGFLPSGDLKYDGFCSNIKTINDNNQATDASDVTVYMSNPELYEALHISHLRDEYGNLVVYGGPGK